MNKLWVCLSLLVLTGSLAAQPLKVAVASSMAPAFKEISSHFTRSTGISIEATYDSAGKLTAQIINGHPYQLFLSADEAFTQILQADGLTAEPPQAYAQSVIVLWSLQADFDAPHWPQWLASHHGHIAVPSPQLTAQGQAVARLIDAYHLRPRLQGRQIEGVNTAQTAMLVSQNLADAGFITKAELLLPGNRDRGRWVALPQAGTTPLRLTMALLRSGKNDPAALHLYRYLASSSAQEVLQRYGYEAPHAP